jgi:hypothetical protein
VVDFSLTVGQSQQTVTVDAQVTQVDRESTTVQSVVETKQINDLPLNGRNFTDLITLVPGVSGGSQVGNGGANLLYGLGDCRSKKTNLAKDVSKVALIG